MKKRITSLALVLLLLISTFPVTIFAAAPATFTVTPDKASVEAGETITFTVKTSFTVPSYGFLFVPDIPSGLTYVPGSGTLDSNLKTTTGADGDVSFTEAGKLLIVAGSAPLNGLNNLPVMTFQCTVDNTAAVGTYEIGLAQMEVLDENVEDIAAQCLVNKAEVTVKAFLNGELAAPTGIVAPVKGAATDVSAITLPTGLTVKSAKWVNTKTSSDSDAFFAPETAYKLVIFPELVPGYLIATNATMAKPNGAESIVTNFGTDGKIEILYPATLGADSLAGTVTLDNTTPKFGDTITANTSALDYGTEGAGALSYQWYRGDAKIDGATSASYTTVAADVGKTIKVEVKNSKNAGSVSSLATAAVAKVDYSGAGAVAAIVTKTHDTVTVTNVTAGQEYSIDNASWKTTGTFTGLNPAADYTVYTRVAETATTNASAAATTAVTTDKAPAGTPVAPVVSAKSDTTITVTAVSGQKYMIKLASEAAPTAADNGWSETVAFTGLTPNTAYKIYTYIPESSTTVASTVVYTEQKTDKVTITDALVPVTDLTGKVFNGAAQEPTFGGSLVRDTDYTVSYSSGNAPVNAGTYTVTVTGKGNYAGSFTKQFTVDAKRINNATIADIAEQTYTGSAITPEPAVTDGSALVKNADFTYEYENNTDAGTATVKVIGKGNYTGTITKDFTIVPMDQTINGGDFGATTGGTVNLTTKFTAQGELSFAIEGNDPTGSSVTGGTLTVGTTEGTFQLKVTAAATANYKSAEKTVTVTASDKPSQTISADDVTAIYGDTNKAVSATTNVSDATISYVVTSGAEVVDVDAATGALTIKKAGSAVVTVIASETEVYGETTKLVNITVAPKAIAAPAADATVYTYNGEVQTYQLAANEAYTITGATQTNANETGYTVTVALNDTVSYKWDDDTTADKSYTFIINKATITVTATSKNVRVNNTLPDLSAPVLNTDYTVTGLFGSDELVGTVAMKYQKEGVDATPDMTTTGTYDIIISGVTEPATGNYNAIVLTNGTLTVSRGSSGGGAYVPPTKPEVEEVDGKTCSCKNFADIAKDAWYHTAVCKAIESGIMKGIEDGVFAPNAKLTRAQLMTMLARQDGVDTEGGATWYAKGMEWAVANGISDGTMPEADITREQLVTMLYRYAKAEGKSVVASANLANFGDASDVSEWAFDSVKWAVAIGVMKGSDGALNPQGAATRAEVAQFFLNFSSVIG